MTSHVPMAARVDAYLAFRRGLGYRLRTEGGVLLNFAAFADEAGHRGPVTTELALRWARATTSTDRLYWARRLEVVRTLARHLAATEPGTEIPARGLLGPAHRRTAPHIYTDAQIEGLMDAAGRLGPPGGLRPDTYRTLFGLLAATGLRISEALVATRADVELNLGAMTVRRTKFRKTRRIPLHPTAVVALRAYADRRDRIIPKAASDRFFVGDRGFELPYSTVRTVFRGLCDAAVATGTGRRRPRIHDFRHTFACRNLEARTDAGVDSAPEVAALSVYLGHAKVTDTYWYLTATPDLMARAAARFEQLARPDGGEVLA